MDLSPSGGDGSPSGRGAAPDAPAVGPDYRLFVNDESTVLVRVWGFWTIGRVEVCVRPDRDAIWGPPLTMIEEHVPDAR